MNVEDYVKNWELAKKGLENVKQHVLQCECEVDNTTNNLGKFLTPPGAKHGEIFNVWYGNGMLQVTFVKDNTFEVVWRIKPTKPVV